MLHTQHSQGTEAARKYLAKVLTQQKDSSA